jgi:hypothetical protein
MRNEIQAELMKEIGLEVNANPELRRKRRKRGLEAELEELVPGLDKKELENQFFYSHKEKKQSLAEISSHMMAVNKNHNIKNYFLQGEGKKVKKSLTMPVTSTDNKEN